MRKIFFAIVLTSAGSASGPALAQCSRGGGGGLGAAARSANRFGGPAGGLLGSPYFNTGFNGAGLNGNGFYNPSLAAAALYNRGLAAGLGGYGVPLASTPAYSLNNQLNAAYQAGLLAGQAQSGQASGGLRASSRTTAAPVASTQKDLARSLQDLSARRPLHSGTVVQVAGAGVQVRYSDGVSSRTATFPLAEVFFFRANGDLATAAASPGELKAGDQVLVPEPVAARQASVQ